MGFSHIDNNNQTVWDINVVIISPNPFDCCRNTNNANGHWLFSSSHSFFFYFLFLLFVFVLFANRKWNSWTLMYFRCLMLDAHLLLGIFYDEFSQVHAIFSIFIVYCVGFTMVLFILRLLLPQTQTMGVEKKMKILQLLLGILMDNFFFLSHFCCCSNPLSIGLSEFMHKQISA